MTPWQIRILNWAMQLLAFLVMECGVTDSDVVEASYKVQECVRLRGYGSAESKRIA